MSEVNWKSLPKGIVSIKPNAELPIDKQSLRFSSLADSGIRHDETGSKINAPIIASTVDKANGIS